MLEVSSGKDDFVWSGELSGYAESLAGVKASGRFDVLGQPFLVPTREDYAEAFQRAGLLEAAEAEHLAKSPECVAVAQAHWHSTGSTGCVFAAHMSGLREETGWETVVLSARGSAKQDAEAVALAVHPRLTDPAADVISVVIPHGDEASYVVELVQRLGALPGWSLSTHGIEEDPDHGELALIGLRNDVEFEFVAEVLGFGPFAYYANTRQAPFTEFAIRAKPPSKRRRDKRAFMAHVDIPHLAKDEVGLWWSQTEANRRARLSPSQDARGKAKVSVALPRELWDEKK